MQIRETSQAKNVYIQQLGPHSGYSCQMDMGCGGLTYVEAI
jgi:hypothetical protein